MAIRACFGGKCSGVRISSPRQNIKKMEKFIDLLIAKTSKDFVEGLIIGFVFGFGFLAVIILIIRLMYLL
jgi:hypothetical protein